MSLPDNIADCHKLIRTLSEQVLVFSSKIKELEARLGQNSNNSSKPPSSDMVKPKRKPGIKRKRKKSGGQKGHKGNTLKMVEPNEVNKTKLLKPDRCRCGQRLLRQGMEVESRRQVFDIPDPQLLVTEYQLLGCDCPKCGRHNVGVFPEHVKAPVQYGSGVRALISLLSIKCQLSQKNISELFEDLFGYAVNSATIQSTLDRAYKQSEKVAHQIKAAALSRSILHLDETGMQIQKKRSWLHTMCNDTWTWLHIHSRRGKKALQANTPGLFDYSGVVVHDCWSTYWSLTSATHVLCNAHLLRELKALMEQDSKWATRMHRLLMKLYEKYTQGQQIDRLSLEWRQYDTICRAAFKEEPPPVKNARGKPKKTKGRNLAERFEKHKEAILRFAIEPGIPFTNNQAERDVRPAKGKLKIAGCFRTWKGAQQYARLQSVFSTWKKQQYDIFKELKAILNGSQFSFAEQMT